MFSDIREQNVWENVSKCDILNKENLDDRPHSYFHISQFLIKAHWLVSWQMMPLNTDGERAWHFESSLGTRIDL